MHMVFCAAAPSTSPWKSINLSERNAGVVAVALFQATNHILGQAGLVTCHPGNREKKEEKLAQAISVCSERYQMETIRTVKKKEKEKKAMSICQSAVCYRSVFFVLISVRTTVQDSSPFRHSSAVEW